MSKSSPLDEWRFLVGEWKSKTKNQFGEKGIVEGKAVFSMEPSDKFLMTKGEAWCEGRLLNKSISILFYDSVEQKFKRKTFFSYGFVNNEVECYRSSTEIKFDVKMEPLPKQFEGTRWRSYIQKISENKIATGLETAKGDEEFQSYGETVATRSKAT